MIAWGLLDPRFRDAEGFLDGRVCLPASLGVALIIVGAAIATPFARFAFWLSLGLVGQALALQMIDAGPAIRYQHYKPPARLFAEIHPLLLIALVAQTAFVIGGLRRRWPAIRSWTARTFKVWQLLGMGVAFSLTSAAVSREIPLYAWDLLFATFIQMVNLGNLIVMALALPGEAHGSLRATIDTLLDPPESSAAPASRGVDRLVLLAAVWVTVLAAGLNVFSYERHPHVPDEVVYLYHARSLAAGALTLPAPRVPEAFDIYLMNADGDRWYSSVPPGWPALLALGGLLGVPWLVNPLLAGLSVLLTFSFVRQIYDRRTARMAALLLSISPWHIFMGMNFLNHMPVLVGGLAGALAVMRARTTGNPAWGGLAGLAVGLVSLIRPLDGLILAGLLGLWALGLGGRRLHAAGSAAFVLGAFVAGAVVLPYNKLLTGDPIRFPIMAYTDKHFGPGANALGFGANRGLGWPLDPFPGHGPLDAVVNANLNTFSLNTELFGWSTGSLVFVFLLVFSGGTRGSDYLMLATIAAVVLAHSFYWYSGGPDFGARYWYLVLVPSVTLTARGIQHLEGASAGNAARVRLAACGLCLLTLVNYVPWRAIDKYHHYLGMRPDIRRLATERGFGKSLVLIRGKRHPDYASAAVYNPMDLTADAPVYAWDRGPAVRAQLLNAFADRPVWIVNGPSFTRRGFQVLEGPRPGSELMRRGE
ncbi:MAG: glycosyltransferase family 39 protein [Candidatus Rokubacteria bacterium]|nr:glycosyltransferase family 39 protein [Candidatus Rokubacteria bacterium]